MGYLVSTCRLLLEASADTAAATAAATRQAIDWRSLRNTQDAEDWASEMFLGI